MPLSFQIDGCVDETATADTCPMSYLRFMPPFAATLPHCDCATIDPIPSHGGQGPYNSLGGGRARAATEPLSLQQQQQQQ